MKEQISENVYMLLCSRHGRCLSAQNAHTLHTLAIKDDRAASRPAQRDGLSGFSLLILSRRQRLRAPRTRLLSQAKNQLRNLSTQLNSKISEFAEDTHAQTCFETKTLGFETNLRRPRLTADPRINQTDEALDGDDTSSPRNENETTMLNGSPEIQHQNIVDECSWRGNNNDVANLLWTTIVVTRQRLTCLRLI